MFKLTTRFAFGATLLLAAFSLLTSCVKNKPLVVPEKYDGSNFEKNTTAEATIRANMVALANAMKKGDTQGVLVDFATLSNLYKSGNPSLESITTAYYSAKIAGTGNWLDELAKASGGTYKLGAPIGNGGVYVKRLLDENGLELTQMVDKGLYAAAMYNEAIRIMQEPATAATSDRLLSLWGAHPNFPNTNTAANTTTPDAFTALYAARRDRNDGAGLYLATKKALITLQAAIKAGDDYQEERNGALADFRSLWEKAVFATVINYCHAATSKLSSTDLTDAIRASALHDYSEVVGFIHGWRTIDTKYRIISDAQIDELLVLLNAPYNGAPASYKFASDPVNELPKFTQVINKVKALYTFSDQEILDFKENWISKQGR